MREALRPCLGKDDWEQQALFGRSSSPIAEIARIGHGHISMKEIRSFLPEETWQEYFKFAIVRNPYERFVSVCSFLNRDNPEFSQQPRRWMKAAMTRPGFRQRVLVRPQFEQLCDAGGTLAMDFVGRHESLQASFEEIFSHIGLAPPALERRNTSSHMHHDEYYDEDLRSYIERFYALDFQQFNYDLERR